MSYVDYLLEKKLGIDGKFAIIILKICQVISAIVALIALRFIYILLTGPATDASYSDLNANCIVVACSLFTFVIFTVSTVIVRNVIEIRKNTEK